MRCFRYISKTLVADLNISVTINGGYTPTFSSNTGVTDITGPITINSGTVYLNNYIIYDPPYSSICDYGNCEVCLMLISLCYFTR